MIREATLADAEGLAGLQLRAWLRAWPDDHEAIAALDDRCRRWDELLDEPGRTLAFDQDGRVAGFAVVGPGRDADLGPEVGELLALYVDPPATRQGTGRARRNGAAGDRR